MRVLRVTASAVVLSCVIAMASCKSTVARTYRFGAATHSDVVTAMKKVASAELLIEAHGSAGPHIVTVAVNPSGGEAFTFRAGPGYGSQLHVFAADRLWADDPRFSGSTVFWCEASGLAAPSSRIVRTWIHAIESELGETAQRVRLNVRRQEVAAACESFMPSEWLHRCKTKFLAELKSSGRWVFLFSGP